MQAERGTQERSDIGSQTQSKHAKRQARMKKDRQQGMQAERARQGCIQAWWHIDRQELVILAGRQAHRLAD
jgi:hypothetical protein